MYEDMIKHKESCHKNMRCMFRCGEYFRPQNFREHMGKCKFMKMICNNCGDIIKRGEI